MNANGPAVWLVAVPPAGGASTGSANDAVTRDEILRVLQDLINGIELKGIEFGIEYKSVLALATVSREAFVMPKRICLD